MTLRWLRREVADLFDIQPTAVDDRIAEIQREQTKAEAEAAATALAEATAAAARVERTAAVERIAAAARVERIAASTREARWPSGVATRPQEPPAPDIAPETPPAPAPAHAEGRPDPELVDIEALSDDDLVRMAEQSRRGLTITALDEAKISELASQSLRGADEATRKRVRAAVKLAKEAGIEYSKRKTKRDRPRRQRKRRTSRGDAPDQER